jgi:ArsR family transcriptional regulator, arsenate/arsenite/antimonite-responsive transcriptional repressor
VAAARDGRFVRYAVHVGGMRRLIAYLTEDCCQGRPELCGAAFVASKQCGSVKPGKGARK